MKKSVYLAAAAFMLFFVATPKQAAAQKYQGQVVIGTNGAFSLVGAAMTFAFNTIDKVEGLNTNVIPGLQGTVDFGITDRFSLGLAHFYQSGKATWSGYTDTAGNVYTGGEYFFRVTRQNTAVRALFHFGDNDDFDPYFGIRLGYSYWSTNTNVPNGSGIDVSKFTSRLRPQAVFGVRYFFIPNLGVNAEIALGFPYYMSAGINFRFGGLK